MSILGKTHSTKQRPYHKEKIKELKTNGTSPSLSILQATHSNNTVGFAQSAEQAIAPQRRNVGVPGIHQRLAGAPND